MRNRTGKSTVGACTLEDIPAGLVKGEAEGISIGVIRWSIQSRKVVFPDYVRRVEPDEVVWIPRVGDGKLRVGDFAFPGRR